MGFNRGETQKIKLLYISFPRISTKKLVGGFVGGFLNNVGGLNP